MINTCILVGRLTKDPEIRRTYDGKAVTTFNLAVNRGFKSQDGQEADFISIVTWNKQAENVAQYCFKGSLVGIEGSIRTRNYDNNQGQRVYVTEVLANRVQFLESKKDNQEQQFYQNAQANTSQNNESWYDDLVNNGDLPF